MELWRLVKARWADTAFDGEGARRFGGRWNSPGTRVAYAAANSALAVLEVLVHLQDEAVLPAWSLVQATIPDDLVTTLHDDELPAGWDTSPVPPAVQAIGDRWVRDGAGAVLRVPSALVPGGSNFLLDPAHPDATRLLVVAVTPFGFDPRLLRRER